MKKFIILLALTATCICSVVTFKVTNVFAQDNLTVSAKSAYLIDAGSKTVIYSKNENERLPIASMTKIMLLLLAFEKNAKNQFDLNQKILVSERASSMGGSQVFLQANKEYLASDLIKSVIIASANDASVAIAEKLFGSEENAVDIMNKKAKQLKLNNTLFSNCTGLPKPTQYSCAKDVAIMTLELCKYPKYFEYSSIYLDQLTHPDGQKTTLTNTNKLTKFYSGCDGGKTGFTNEAGFCLSSTAKRGNMRVIGVLINEPDSKTRFSDCSKMFNYCFENYDSKAILSTKNAYEHQTNVECGKKSTVTIFPERDFYVFGKKNVDEKVTVEYHQPDKIKAPIKKGEKIGEFILYKNGKELATINALAGEDIDKWSFFDYLKEIASA